MAGLWTTLSATRSAIAAATSPTAQYPSGIKIRTRSELEQLGNALLEPLFPVAKGVRLLGE
jgi:hypothetical protein